MACGKLSIAEEASRHCTPCKTDNKEVNSNIYCMDCEAYFCDECFQFHKKVPHLAKHIILKDEDITVWSKVPYKCRTHDRCYEFFCNHHSCLCCQICISLQHRSCTHITFIQETGKNEDSEDKIIKVLEQTEDQINATDTKIKDLKKKTELNEKSQVKAEECVKGFRSRMNTMLDVLELQAYETIHHRYNSNKTKLDKMEESLERLRTVLNDLKQQLLSSQNKNRATLTFMCTELGGQQLNDVKRKLSEVKSFLPQMNFSYIVNPSIEEFLKESLTIGCIQDDDVSNAATSSDYLDDSNAGEQNSNNNRAIDPNTNSNQTNVSLAHHQRDILSVKSFVNGGRGNQSFAGIVKSPSVEACRTKSEGKTSKLKNDVGETENNYNVVNEEGGESVLGDDEMYSTDNIVEDCNSAFADFSLETLPYQKRKGRPRYICSNRFCSFATNSEYCPACGSVSKERDRKQRR